MPSAPSLAPSTDPHRRMTLEEHNERLQELRSRDDPRTDPAAPYTPDWEHLSEKWPEQVEEPTCYLVVWKEEPGSGSAPIRREATAPRLYSARSFAQSASARDSTVAGLAWVQLSTEDEEPETVDVWANGYWLPPQCWTKEGHPPHSPA